MEGLNGSKSDHSMHHTVADLGITNGGGARISCVKRAAKMSGHAHSGSIGVSVQLVSIVLDVH